MLGNRKRYLFVGLVCLLVPAFFISDLGGILRKTKDPVVVKFKNFPPLRKTALHKIAQSEYASDLNSIDSPVLGKFIRGYLLEQFVLQHHVDCSLGAIEKTIKKLPDFCGGDGKFSEEKFSSYIANLGITEKEYLKKYKAWLLSGCVIDTLQNSYVPEKLIAALDKRLTLGRDVIFAYLDLNAYIPVPKATDEDMKRIYYRYEQSFAVPEKRSVSYFVLDKDLPGKNGFDVLKALYDRVEGMQPNETIKDVAKSFGATVRVEKNVSSSSLLKHPVLKHVASSVFSSKAANVSLPVSIGKQFLVWVVSDIRKGSVIPFSEAKKEVLDRYIALERRKGNMKKFESMVLRLSQEKAISENAFLKHVVNTGAQYVTIEGVHPRWGAEELPDEIVDSLVDIPKGSITPVFFDKKEEKICVCWVKKDVYIGSSGVEKDSIRQTLSRKIFSELIEGIFTEQEPKFH
ncbi:peptidylprolyl isomerase [Candidatus Sneabacter namystus]|uniref:Parvulin-like PPIase n=1 Tax=Candidatus Sneabacter namystus TaxID=2601646 RepID=A0A5C0UIG8_9RICK|nr:SurA N-terminal domain-containing protein [Candidatus Sneabacter namystus]QEK39540.1 hypothetical protein FZC37_01130 [Candidatus Sneabacter namystus]